MTVDRQTMMDDLAERGVFVGIPQRRAKLVDGITWEITPRDWSAVLGFLDALHAGYDGRLAAALVAVLSREAGWLDAVTAAHRRSERVSGSRGRTRPAFDLTRRRLELGDRSCPHGQPGTHYCHACYEASVAGDRRTDAGDASVRAVIWLALAALALGGIWSLYGWPAIGGLAVWSASVTGLLCALADEGTERRRS